MRTACIIPSVGIVGVEMIQPLEGGRANGEDGGEYRIAATGAKHAHRRSFAGGVPVNALAGEEMDIVELARILEIVSAASLAGEFEMSAVGQGGELAGFRVQRNACARAGGEFEGELLAVGRHERGVHDTAFEDGG